MHLVSRKKKTRIRSELLFYLTKLGTNKHFKNKKKRKKTSKRWLVGNSKWVMVCSGKKIQNLDVPGVTSLVAYKTSDCDLICVHIYVIVLKLWVLSYHMCCSSWHGKAQNTSGHQHIYIATYKEAIWWHFSDSEI